MATISNSIMQPTMTPYSKQLDTNSTKNSKKSIKYFGCTIFAIIFVLAVQKLSHSFAPFDRIVNGTDANADDYPWMVSLRETVGSLKQTFRFCGASLIDTDPIIIVTAAHCLDTYYMDDEGNFMFYQVNGTGVRFNYSVHGMFADLGRTNHPDYAAQIGANEIFITLNITFSMIQLHERWDTESKKNDIALIIINDGQQLPDGYPVATIAQVGEHKLYDEYEALGWGNIDVEGALGTDPDTLQHTVLKFVNNTQCDYMFAKYLLAAMPEMLQAQYNLTDSYPEVRNMSADSLEFVLWLLNYVNMSKDASQICVMGDNTDVCSGDSGGPIFVPTHSEEPLLIGVASHGLVGCNTQEPFPMPSVFTSVAYFQPWIEETVESVIGPVQTTPAPTEAPPTTTVEVTTTEDGTTEMSEDSSESSSDSAESSSNGDAKANDNSFETDSLEQYSDNDTVYYRRIVIGSCIAGVCLLSVLCLVLYLKCTRVCGKNEHIAIAQSPEDEIGDIEVGDGSGNETEMLHMS